MSSLLFLFYGIASGFESMRRDFERFGLGRLRTLVGTLDVLGALGPIVGQLWLPLVPNRRVAPCGTTFVRGVTGRHRES